MRHLIVALTTPKCRILTNITHVSPFPNHMAKYMINKMKNKKETRFAGLFLLPNNRSAFLSNIRFDKLNSQLFHVVIMFKTTV